ncbi:O-methyltransferase [Halalkalibacterium ligniniphilum]|uniref:O-methyltransferase n=1 Tax=Halalkalibacterium ligniniphilum TaxID=1134413 RepID=UPI000346DD27|nr:O-methyltransferase [Halalkalibacterium ligniniphilum]
MIDKKIETYLKELVPSRGEKIEKIEAYAEKHGVPIMDLVGMESLLQILKVRQPDRILEIGTAIGYSAIRMATTISHAMIVTIERDKERYEQAVKNVSELGLTNRITIHYGDALEVSEKLEQDPLFDVLFIDAAKGQYQRFFSIYGQRVKPGGMILSDNILFRGYVAEEEIEHKRHRQLAEKMKHYNRWLMEHPDYDTRMLPVGDGLAISIKKR